MLKMFVKFKGYDQLELHVDDTKLGKKYYSLVRAAYAKSFPVLRDAPKYTVEYMLQLANKAKEKLGWEWSFDRYDTSITALLHKDIERLLGAQGFNAVTEDLDTLLHELHYCLHMIQWDRPVTRNGWIQIEWFMNLGFPLEGTSIFKPGMNFGDLRLQNPHVGHGPLQIYLEQDYTNIPQTCKFHNFVKPGINIATKNFGDIDPQLVLAEFKRHCPEFVDLHTEEKILQYTGYPVIGKVVNLDELQKVVAADTLELENIVFDE